MGENPISSPENLTQDEWNEKVAEVQGLVDTIMDRLDEKSWNEQLAWQTIKDEIIKELKNAGETTETLGQYGAYHILIGSSPSYKRQPNFDFEDDLSIQKALRKKLDELSQPPKP